LIYFAAYKKHIGFYPVPSGIEKIDKEFASFKTSGKGTIQFLLNKPMPLNLIIKLVRFKVKENIEKAEKKKQTKKKTDAMRAQVSPSHKPMMVRRTLPRSPWHPRRRLAPA